MSVRLHAGKIDKNCLPAPLVGSCAPLVQKERGQSWRTFADTIQRADLCAIFHCVQSKVNLRYWSLVVDGSHGAVDVLLGVGCLAIHPRRALSRAEECGQWCLLCPIVLDVTVAGAE